MLLYWLLIAVISMVTLTCFGLKLNRIKSPLVRRVTLISVVVVCLPAFILLSVMDYFMRWTDGTLYASEAIKKCLYEIGPGFLSEVKGTW